MLVGACLGDRNQSNQQIDQRGGDENAADGGNDASN